MALLSLAIWTPIVFGVILLALGRDEQVKAVRALALMGALVSLLVTVMVPEGVVVSIVTGRAALWLPTLPAASV